MAAALSVNVPARQSCAPQADLADSPDLAAGQSRGLAQALDYAGAVYPDEAFRIVAAGAILVDVRTAEERKVVGFVPDSVHVAWELGPAQIKNPRFIKDLSTKVPRDQVVLFICRSGRRSAEAASAAAKAGYARSFNVLEGFEGLKGAQ